MLRPLTFLACAIGIVLCLATAGTGIGFIWHPEIREIHLKLAIACVSVSLVGHTLAVLALRKKS